MNNNTPETNAELAQIHFLVTKCREWNSPLAQVESRIKGGDIAEAHAELNSHIATMQHLTQRLGVEVKKYEKSEAA